MHSHSLREDTLEKKAHIHKLRLIWMGGGNKLSPRLQNKWDVTLYISLLQCITVVSKHMGKLFT